MAYYIYDLTSGDVVTGVSTAEDLRPFLSPTVGVIYEEGEIRDFTYLTFDSGSLVYDTAQRAGEIRAQRDELLRLSDYTQLPDVPKDAAVWATYRQALRDIPAQEGFPETATFPDRP